MRKDSRLSFRISNTLSKRIDKAIEKSEGQIRDRSEFGTKSIMFYLDYIENTQSETEIILNSILSLADHVGIQSDEIDHIKSTLEEQTLIPSSISSSKTIDTHPEFEELMNLREKFDDDIQKEISNKLRDATYEDVETIHEEYREKFYMEGNSPKPKKSKKMKKKN